MTKLKLTDVSKHFWRKPVLNKISFEIETGKIYGLLGRNGTGKSTLLNLISNRNFPSNGEITLDGQNINNNSVALNQIYLMSEADNYPKQTKVENLFKLVAASYDDFDQEGAYRMAQRFNLNPKEKLTNLSTGMRTIAKLITALNVQAQFIFLDEPTLGLDAAHRETFYTELLTSFEASEKAIVISTHLISEVQNLLQHVFIIDQQQLVLNQDVEELLAQSYAISGPAAEVNQYLKGLDVAYSTEVPGLKTSYLTTGLDDDRIIPDLVKIEHLDLQQAFIALTQKEASLHD